MGAPYEAAAIANEFLSLSGKDQCPITPMQLLKLVYIAQGWHLAVTGRPLFDNRIEAWKYGPVVPALFHEFKSFGGEPITRLAYIDVGDNIDDIDSLPPFVDSKDQDVLSIIAWVWRQYGRMSGPQLSDLTHQQGTPWHEAYRNGMAPKNAEIDNEAIRKHYLDLWKERHAPK